MFFGGVQGVRCQSAVCFLARLLFVCFSVSWPGNPFAKAVCCVIFRGKGCALSKHCLLKAVCCIRFFVRRFRQLLPVFSILLSCLLLSTHNERTVICLLLLCTHPFGLPSPHGHLLRVSAFSCLHYFGPKRCLFVFPFGKLSLVMISLSVNFVYYY